MYRSLETIFFYKKQIMKITNTLMTILALFIFSNLTMAQSDAKANEMADKRVEEFNEMIVAANPDAKLSQDQKIQIKEKHLARTKKIRAIKKSDSFSEEEKEGKLKVVYKAFHSDVFKNVLTAEQRKAKTEGKVMTAKGKN